MNKKNRLLPILIFLSVGSLTARELRTPYGLDRGPFHYPIPCRPTDEEQCWNVDVWGAGLHRQANTAFIDKNSFDTDESLAGILFGKESFVGLDAFAPGTIAPQNPFLAVAQITPRITYRENTAYFGMYIERQLPWGCDCAWRGGMRVTLPFRAIDINLDCCDPEENLDDFCCNQNDRIDGSNLSDGTMPVLPDTVDPNQVQIINDCFAYRLDFLTALFQSQAGVPPHERFVNYSANTGILPPNVQFGQVNITQPNPPSSINNPINLIRSVDGSKPEQAFCAAQNVVNALPFLNGDGSGGANEDRLRGFDTNTNYAALSNNTAAQRQLWVVPSVVSVDQGGDIVMSLATAAQTVGANIRQLLSTLPQDGALGFFEDHGVTLDPQHLEGLGQMVFEFYANRDWCDWFFEGIVGFNAPTGNKVKNPGEVYKLFNTGNNRHWGVKVGGIATYDPKVWFHLRASTFYWYFAPKTERVAAPFRGATVKNIGPAIDAKISWNQWVGRLDTVWLMPCNPRVGFLLGYEGYIKTKDKVSLQQTTATDFLGNTQPLDANVLERRTKVYSHKVRTEMFHQGSFWELFAGWTHVFAGRNAPKETDWHLGLIAYF